MLRTGLAMAACFTLAAAQAASAQPIFSDGFESYGSTTEMNAAGAWGDNGRIDNAGVLINAGGSPGQYMDQQVIYPNYDPRNTAQHNFDPVVPSDAQPLVFEFDFKDPGSRVTAGLRTDGGGAPLTSIIEVGRYNSVFDPESNTTVWGYAIRTVYIGGTPADWVTFKGNPPVLPGWHHLRATIRASDILFELDDNGDGIADANRVVTTSDGAQPYNVIRLGGPSDLSSTSGAGFDNVSVGLFETTPGLFGTGLSDAGSRLLADSIDPHYTVNTVASAADPVAATPGSPTFVVPEDGFPIPPWVANDASSAWIAPVQDDDATAAPGIYDYSIFFDLTAAEAATAQLLGQWATDDVGMDIFINGTPTGNTNPSSFGGLDPFSIDSGFVAGRNQLTFRVENGSAAANPTGLRVDVQLATTAVPEPSTVILALLGFGGLILCARRRIGPGRRRA